MNGDRRHTVVPFFISFTCPPPSYHFSFPLLLIPLLHTSLSSIFRTSLNMGALRLSSAGGFAVILVLLVSRGMVGCRAEDDDGDQIITQCLNVPGSVFATSVRSTIETLRNVISIVSQFSGAFGDFRLTNAINDCLDLLDFSTEELSWSLSATENPNGKHNSTGNRGSDLRTWLSGALGNQETCMDGFEGTNSFIKPIVAGSINQLTSLVTQILSMIHPPTLTSTTSNSIKNTNKMRYPSWMKSRDRKTLQQGSANKQNAHATVALDGTGNYTSITAAVLAAPDYSTTRYTIYVKRGIYHENVDIKKKKWNLLMVGDGIDQTVISGNRSFIDGWTTFRSATFAVSGRGFMAQGVTFQNTAGPEKHQAVALRSDSDLSVFYRCAIRGYQDTLYAHSLRQFYRDCIITGTVDFIFGDATAVFQNCQILARKGLSNQKNTITAQGRKDVNQNTGFTIQFSNISADADLLTSLNTTQTYLGRPWKLYSRTVFMQSYMSSVIRPQGWLEWADTFALDTLYYGEYMNYGPGSVLASRVHWPGFHALNDSTQATNYTVAQFIDGNLWLPSTGVSYTAGLGH